MEELIKKSDVIKALRLEYPMMPMFKSLREEWAIKTEGFRKAEEVIMNLPSADRPRGEWIPCSERLPDERQDVYVTVFWDNYGDTATAYGRRTQFGWSLWNTVEGELLKGYTVIAWMPLPEPWRGVDDESKNHR